MKLKYVVYTLSLSRETECLLTRILALRIKTAFMWARKVFVSVLYYYHTSQVYDLAVKEIPAGLPLLIQLEIIQDTMLE